MRTATANKATKERKKRSIFIPLFDFGAFAVTFLSILDQELKLSEAFKDVSVWGIGNKTPPPLELTATMYNINQGHNKTMLQKSETLNEHSAFIDKVREYDKELNNLAACYYSPPLLQNHAIMLYFIHDEETNQQEEKER